MALSVWTGLAELTTDRGFISLTWICRSCGHTWTDKTPRPEPVKATARRKQDRRRKA